MTRPYFGGEKWNVLTSFWASCRAQRLNAICLPSSLQYFRLDVATALVIFCRQSRSPSLPARRGPRFDMCLLAPLKSHLSTKGHKDGCYNGKCMFCGTPARQWRHICVRGRLNSGGGVGNNRRTLFTEVSIFEPFTRDNTHNGL